MADNQPLQNAKDTCLAKIQDPRRRAALLDARQHVLASRGVDKATIDEITQSAGVSKGTFYLYFKSKTELVDALRTDFSHKIGDSLRSHLGARSSDAWEDEARKLVHSAVDAYYRIAPSYQAVLDCSAVESQDMS